MSRRGQIAFHGRDGISASKRPSKRPSRIHCLLARVPFQVCRRCLVAATILAMGTYFRLLLNMMARHASPLSFAATASDLRTRTNTKIDAIVTVAMCGFHAAEMVQALRNEGGWAGPIYVITDTPQTEPAAGLDCTLLDVRGRHPTFSTRQEFDHYQDGIRQFTVEIYSKWHKTQIFMLIPPEDQVHTVLFIDADMLAQQPLADEWLMSVTSVFNDPKCQLVLYPERWYTSMPIVGRNNKTLTGDYNSGMMILKRHESRRVLQVWGDLLVRPPYFGRDQGKLTEAIHATDTHVCHLPNHWKHVQNEADLLDQLWFGSGWIWGGRTSGTFRHISSAKKSQRRYQHWNERLQQACNYTNLVYHPM